MSVAMPLTISFYWKYLKCLGLSAVAAEIFLLDLTFSIWKMKIQGCEIERWISPIFLLFPFLPILPQQFRRHIWYFNIFRNANSKIYQMGLSGHPYGLVVMLHGLPKKANWGNSLPPNDLILFLDAIAPIYKHAQCCMLCLQLQWTVEKDDRWRKA